MEASSSTPDSSKEPTRVLKSVSIGYFGKSFRYLGNSDIPGSTESSGVPKCRKIISNWVSSDVPVNRGTPFTISAKIQPMLLREITMRCKHHNCDTKCPQVWSTSLILAIHLEHDTIMWRPHEYNFSQVYQKLVPGQNLLISTHLNQNYHEHYIDPIIKHLLDWWGDSEASDLCVVHDVDGNKPRRSQVDKEKTSPLSGQDLQNRHQGISSDPGLSTRRPEWVSFQYEQHRRDVQSKDVGAPSVVRFLYSLVIAIKLSADGSPNGRGWNSLVLSLKTNPLECYDSSSHPVFGLVHDSVGSFTNLLELLIPLHASRQTGSRVVVETAYGTASLVMEVPAKWERPRVGSISALCPLQQLVSWQMSSAQIVCSMLNSLWIGERTSPGSINLSKILCLK